MADKQLSALTAASALDDADLLFISQGGNSRKATVAQLRQASAFSGALVKKSTDQTGINATGTVAVSWNSEVYDTGGYHDTVTNSERLSVPVGVSRVKVSGQVKLANVTADTYITLFIFKNGSVDWDGMGEVRAEVGSTAPSIAVSTAIVDVTGGTDYFSLHLLSESDTSVDITAARSWFSIEAIS